MTRHRKAGCLAVSIASPRVVQQYLIVLLHNISRTSFIMKLDLRPYALQKMRVATSDRVKRGNQPALSGIQWGGKAGDTHIPEAFRLFGMRLFGIFCSGKRIAAPEQAVRQEVSGSLSHLFILMDG
jgi:hypothetical protein